MKSMLAQRYVTWATARAERLFFVYGMRRSGNHACVRWLANALEGASTSLIETQVGNNFYVSDSQKTIFINDISSFDGLSYLRFLRTHLKTLRRASFIIISAEDCGPVYTHTWRTPKRSEVVHVRRSSLNLIASRFHNLNQRARAGKGFNHQTMDERFFATLAANISSPRGVVWELERWSTEVSWRRDFLSKLGLHHDLAPSISDEGGGSSFSGMRHSPAGEQLQQRFAMVEPQGAWVAFLRHAASQYPDVFEPRELDAIRLMPD